MAENSFQLKPRRSSVVSPSARLFSSVPAELLALFILLAPIFAFVGIALLHSSLLFLVSGTNFALTLGLPLGGLLLAACVILLNNTIHALLALIGVFVSFVAVYLTQGIEYLAFVFLIVYVGAVAILFLFVIMLLNVKSLSKHTQRVQHITQLLAVFFGVLLFCRLFTALQVGGSDLALLAQGLASSEASSLDSLIYTVNFSGDITAFSPLFTTESPLFLLSLMILLVAMLGAIILATKSMEAGNIPVDKMEIFAPKTVAVTFPLQGHFDLTPRSDPSRAWYSRV
jgi:NADH-quinone oxidoreductase subunit J